MATIIDQISNYGKQIIDTKEVLEATRQSLRLAILDSKDDIEHYKKSELIEELQERNVTFDHKARKDVLAAGLRASINERVKYLEDRVAQLSESLVRLEAERETLREEEAKHTEQVVEVAKEPTADTITYTIVERNEQGKSPFYARVFVPGEEVQDFDPIRHDEWWKHSQSDLVFAVNKAFKGAWYLKPEVFDARVEAQKVQSVASELDIPASEVVAIAAIAQQVNEDKQMERATFEAETMLETVSNGELTDEQRQAILAQKRAESAEYLARMDEEIQAYRQEEIARSQVQKQEELQHMKGPKYGDQQMKKIKEREYHVYVHDGMGLYIGMQNFVATSPEEAIEKGQRAGWTIPNCCTQWVATTERAYVRSGQRKQQERRETMQPTKKYYFALRGNTGGFYIHLHKSDTDEPLMSTTPYSYEQAQRVADNFNKAAGLVAPVDDDYSEEEFEEDQQ